MRTINFGKNLRLSQIQPIKTSESQIYPIWKKKRTTLHPVYIKKYYRSIKNIQPEFSRLLRFFDFAKINQSDTAILDVDQSPSSIFAE